MIQYLENIQHKDSKNFFLIAGPCIIEGEDMALRIAEKVVELTNKYEIPYIFKGSFKKANRSRVDSFTTIGEEKSLEILKKVGETFNIPTTTDIHENEHAALAANYVDVLQIPAFLVRQTDLLIAAAKTNKCVTLKKGQFLSPWEIAYILEKVAATGNRRILITERGTTFGYNNLVVDFRSLPIVRAMGCPVVFDATHSVQLPGGAGCSSGGMRAMVPTLARAAVAAGVDGLFMEVYPDPDTAPCDGPNALALDGLEKLLGTLQALDAVVKNRGAAKQGGEA